MNIIWQLLITILGVPIVFNCIVYIPLFMIQNRRFKKNIFGMIYRHKLLLDSMEDNLHD